MPFQELFVLAIASMALLAAVRVVRVHVGRTPHPDGWARWPFIVAFVTLPPLALGVLMQPDGDTGLLSGLAWVPIYGGLIVAVMLAMRIAAVIVGLVLPRRVRPLLVLGLTGSEGDPYAMPYYPPVTAALALSVAQVDRTNGVFPRGITFADEIERPGFRAAWDACDAATQRLEAAIAEDTRQGRGAALSAMETAEDARSRLQTLRRLAVDSGQTWVPA